MGAIRGRTGELRLTVRRLDRAAARDVLRLTEDTRDTIVRIMAKDRLSPFRRQASTNALRSIDEALDDYRDRYGDILVGHQRNAASEALRAKRQVSDRLRLNPEQFFSGIDARVIEGLGHTRANLVRGLDDAARGRVREAIFRGGLLGDTPAEIEASVRGELEKAIFQRGPEAVSGNVFARAEAIVRTEVLRAHSTANFLGGQELALAVPGLKKRWVSVLFGTERARESHEELHGTVIPYDHTFMSNGVPLLYPRDPVNRIGNLMRYLAEIVNCICDFEDVLPAGY